jgi:hypothetical protein
MFGYCGDYNRQYIDNPTWLVQPFNKSKISKQHANISFWIIMGLLDLQQQLKKSLEIWYAWLVADFICSK